MAWRQCDGGFPVREYWGLWVCIIVYTATFFWFGMFVYKISDQHQLADLNDAAWVDGCKKCAQFEKNKCERDLLQGESHEPAKLQ